MDRRPLGQLAREPLYNTRAVVQDTGVPADTFRAWERRYGLPRPHRTSGNQRLYSERDIGVISWLRDRTKEGMTISQAIQRLRVEHPDVLKPEPAPDPLPLTPLPQSDVQIARLRQRMIEAAMVFDDVALDRVIDEALALYSVEEVCTTVVEPALIEIGERWATGELSVAVEHFATRTIARRLSMIFNMVSPATGRGTILAACAPGEEHEVGLLILAIFLSRRNWRVIYLGANVPIDDLVETVRQVRPDLVCISAATELTKRNGLEAAARVRQSVSSPPPVAYGGMGFAHMTESPTPNAHRLTGRVPDVVEQIIAIVEGRAPHRARSARGW